MAERGPLPSPHARRRNKRTVSDRHVEVSRPSMPRTLTGEAAAEWKRIVPELEKMGLLTSLDRAVLIRYCRVWADWVDVDANLQKTGPLIKGRRDGLVRNPLWLLRSDAESTLSDLMKQLGLTPNARLRIGVAHDAPEQEEESDRPTALDAYRKMVSG